jgi:hypothetical protein
VRTLRALGLDLPTIRKVVDREISLPLAAAAPTEARNVQTWTLRLQRSLPTVAQARLHCPGPVSASDKELAASLIGHWMIGFQADQDLAWALLLEDGGSGGGDAGSVARAFLQKAQ